MQSAGISIYIKLAWRFMKARWLTFLLLGVLLIFSAMLYTSAEESLTALEDSSDAYFEETRQEDFSVDVSQALTDAERDRVAFECDVGASDLTGLYLADRECFESILEDRLNGIESALEDTSLEARLHHDLSFDMDGEQHRMRILNDAEAINLSYIEAGEKPGPGEIAILSNYADHHDLNVGDALLIEGESYTISGFVLFPDYNLPVFDYPLLLDTTHRTLALLHEDDFFNRGGPEVYYSGITEREEQEFEEQLTPWFFATNPFVQDVTPTTYNIRSGAIYAEIEAGSEAALFVALLVGFIAFAILLLLLSKALKQSRSSFGVLKALGVPPRAFSLPLLTLVSLYALLFLSVGYALGILFAPWLQDLFLQFYLLPGGEITFQPATFAAAALLPLALLVGLFFLVINRMLKARAIDMIVPKISDFSKVSFRFLHRLLRRLSFILRLQIAFITRQMGKFSLFLLGMVAAAFAGFLSLSMVGVLDRTVPAYYEGIDVESKGYCEAVCVEAPDGEKAIETTVRLDGDHMELYGLDAEQSLHPLVDRDGEDITDALTEGLVISESVRDLTGLSVGDEVDLRVANYTKEMEVRAVADVYAGNFIFSDRVVLAEWLFADPDAYNVVYSGELLDEAGFAQVIHTEDTLEHMDSIHDVFNAFLAVFIISALIIGLIVVYLLSVMSVEDQYYPLALFKVLGYDNKEIHRILLGGYTKASVLALLISIPFSMVAFNLLSTWFMRMYGFAFPLSLKAWHVIVFAVLFSVMAYLGMLSAKWRINRVKLQRALQIYQE